MSALDDLIQEIADENLRRRIEKEITTLKGTKKFGLVFEPQNPECTPLYDVPVKKKSLVALKVGKLDELYRVTKIVGDEISCVRVSDGEEMTFNKDEVISVAQFGDAIYPYLQPLDTVCNAPDSSLWHALIEADNYHALQLLKYLYGGKVDCIYIDPPYNTGARDWKYNNDYVDASNEYRHSKWLSMMERRLKLSKELLNPRDSVLIVTIDEHEYLHLGCLLEEIFRGANIQMISSIINPKGVSNTKGFRRADEYIFFVMLGDATPCPLPLANEWSPSAIRSATSESESEVVRKIGWTSMMRRGTSASRNEVPNLYYAIYADPQAKKIVKVGTTIPRQKSKDEDIDGLIQILPIRTNGNEGRWQVSSEELKRRIEQGRVKLGKRTTYGFTVNYLPDGEYQKILDGDYKVIGKETDGSLITESVLDRSNNWIAPTQWKIASHDASAYGSALLTNIFVGGGRFSFPKSLYAVRDALKFFVANKPDALIVDFFAGSGTTLHAVNLLNVEDGGNRRCILVTNNEVSDAEEKNLRSEGYTPADEKWQRLGVARYVTWPRTVCSIEGHDINSASLNGNYLGSNLPMADGFKANAAFFKLGFLDKDYVALGRQFKELLPVLWFKAGCRGKCPTVDENNLPPMLILPANNFAVLIDEKFFSDFERVVLDCTAIDTIFIVTDSDYGYHAMIKNFADKTTYQLYRDYLENFKISG